MPVRKNKDVEFDWFSARRAGLYVMITAAMPVNVHKFLGKIQIFDLKFSIMAVKYQDIIIVNKKFNIFVLKNS